MMLVVLKLWKLGVGLLAGLLLGWIVFKPIGYAQGERFGRAAQDVVWQKREADAKDQRERERLATQTEIQKIEADYLQRDAQRQADMAALDRALQDALNDVPTPTPSPGAPPVCRPAIPRGVSDALRGVGRPAPGNDPAKPHGAVR